MPQLCISLKVFSSFDLPARQLPPLVGKAAPPLDAMMPVGGECAIEMVGGKQPPLAIPSGCRGSLSQSKVGRHLLRAPTSSVICASHSSLPGGGTPIYSSMPPERVPRPDIDAALQLDNHLPTGFATTFNLQNLTCAFDLRVVQEFGGTSRVCPNKVRVENWENTVVIAQGSPVT